ncbi:MAG TPA: tetratricopeptide repeat-containing sensor histidine kinase [Acidimicrobiia bacterium]|jgi:signal transduction histidine kinase
MDTLATARAAVDAASDEAGRQRALTALAASLFEYDSLEAVAVAEEAIELARRLGDSDGMAWARHNRAWALGSLGRLSESLVEQLAVLEHFEATGDPVGTANALMAIGDIYSDAGDTATALDYLERAVAPMEHAGDRLGRGVLMNLTALAMSHAGRHGGAAKLFSEAQGVFSDLHDPLRVAMAMINRGFELLVVAEEEQPNASNLIVETETVAREVIACGSGLGDAGRNTVAYGRSLLAQVHARAGNVEAALAEAAEAQLVAARGGFDTLVAEIALDRAEWLTAGGRPREALEITAWVADQSAASGNNRNLARAASLRADALEALGDHEGALVAHREYHRLDGAVRSEANELRAMLTAERLQVEQTRREAEVAQLRVVELEKLDHSKRDFLASVSHELRTPLAAVLGFATELADAWDAFEPAEARSLVELIARQAADLASIVEDLLTMTRLEAGTMTVHCLPVDVGEVVAHTAKALGREWDRDVRLRGTATAAADPLRLRQIVRNLLTNAFRYGGSDVWVDVRGGADDVVIDVCDSGGPIPLPRVVTMFDPFDHEEGDGRRPHSVGMGLAVARSLAALMGGNLAYLHVGEASIFRLTLLAASTLQMPRDSSPRAVAAQ